MEEQTETVLEKESVTEINRRAVLVGIALVSAIAWVQVWRIVTTRSPDPMMISVVLLLLMPAIGGLGALVSWILLRRRGRARLRTLLRHGFWAGISASLLAWLQLSDALTGLVAVVLVGIFVTAESLFLLRELGM